MGASAAPVGGGGPKAWRGENGESSREVTPVEMAWSRRSFPGTRADARLGGAKRKSWRSGPAPANAASSPGIGREPSPGARRIVESRSQVASPDAGVRAIGDK